jgi:hypothetical protein
VSVAVASLAHAGSGSPGFEITYQTETPGTQNATLASTSKFSVVGIEDFNSLSTGYYDTFSTNYGLVEGVNAKYDITGTYTALSGNSDPTATGTKTAPGNSGLQINGADQYGGANGTGNYVVTFDNPGYKLSLTTDNPAGITYFGYWLSALDEGNTVSFYDGSTLLFTFNPVDVLTAVGDLSSCSNQYCGNPNAPFTGNNGGQPYVFLNFYATGGLSFTSVVFSETPAGGGYESDNHTVGDYTTIVGTPVTPTHSTFGPGVSGVVPEPATWSLLIGGVGLVGAGLRMRRRAAPLQA